MNKISHVLIAGAGLGGPALALSLARQGIRSTIFEIRSEPSKAGGSITLTSRAIRALDQSTGTYSKLRDVGFNYTNMAAFDDEGYHYGSIVVGDNVEGYQALRIMRHQLQSVLLETCNDFDKMVSVRWGSECIKIDDSEKGVMVTFSDGTTLQGDVLIGCDGIHSKVRDHILPVDSPKPTFFGQCTVNGFLPATSITLPQGYPPNFFIVSAAGFLMVVPIDKDAKTLAWGITADTIERDRAGWKDYEVSGQAAKDAKALFADIKTEPLRSILDTANESEAKVWPHSSIPDIKTWHRGRVCLMGDAAHALPPNGQGTELAFEDAAFLSRLLTSDQAVGQGFDKLFNHFEMSRRKRVDEIRRSARPSQVIKTKARPWVWWAKRWALWAFFSWNKGQVHMGKGKTYDVMAEDVLVK